MYPVSFPCGLLHVHDIKLTCESIITRGTRVFENAIFFYKKFAGRQLFVNSWTEALQTKLFLWMIDMSMVTPCRNSLLRRRRSEHTDRNVVTNRFFSELFTTQKRISTWCHDAKLQVCLTLHKVLF